MERMNKRYVNDQIITLNGIIFKYREDIEKYNNMIGKKKDSIEKFANKIKTKQICIDHLESMVKMYTELTTSKVLYEN